LRIASGSGTTVAQINSLVKRFEDAQRMMKAMAGGGGMPAMPGAGGGPGAFGGMPGGKKSKGKQVAPRLVKGKSGNPAKRAEQERALRNRSDVAPGMGTQAGSAFGLPRAPEPEFDPSKLPSLGKYLRG
jgi:signal recognition particle subunit SRP54